MKTMTAVAVAMLLAANAHATPQHAEKPMAHGKTKMDHADMNMPATPSWAQQPPGNIDGEAG